MANNLLRLPLVLKPSQVSFLQQVARVHNRAKVGSREVVGFGFNGEANYADRLMQPFPSVRFREVTPDIQAVKDKEKGDWKKLSIEDKKTLYRASFCQTFAEMRAPTGRWKSTLGCSLAFMALSFWVYLWAKIYVYPPLPSSFSLERRQAQLQTMIDMRVDQVDGLTSKWDYENNRWKK